VNMMFGSSGRMLRRRKGIPLRISSGSPSGSPVLCLAVEFARPIGWDMNDTREARYTILDPCRIKACVDESCSLSDRVSPPLFR
jgi:hypothetical protein